VTFWFAAAAAWTAARQSAGVGGVGVSVGGAVVDVVDVGVVGVDVVDVGGVHVVGSVGSVQVGVSVGAVVGGVVGVSVGVVVGVTVGAVVVGGVVGGDGGMAAAVQVSNIALFRTPASAWAAANASWAAAIAFVN